MCVIHRPQALTFYSAFISGGVFPAAYFDSDVDKDFITRSSQRWERRSLEWASRLLLGNYFSITTVAQHIMTQSGFCSRLSYHSVSSPVTTKDAPCHVIFSI